VKKILFLGQKGIAERCLACLLKPDYSSALSVVAVGSVPGSQLALSTPHFIANTERNEKAIIDLINDLRVDVLISVQHPWILSGQVIEAVKGNAFNLHNAKLPDYRGHNSISHAILNGEKTYTTTIHWIIPRVDMGDIAHEEMIPMMSGEVAVSLYERSVEAAVRNFEKLARDLAEGRTPPRRPVAGAGHFYGKNDIEKLKDIVDIHDVDEVDRKARAFYFPPHEPAYYMLDGTRFYVSRKPY
jgi:methionyl-tRNA formyltransferase